MGSVDVLFRAGVQVGLAEAVETFLVIGLARRKRVTVGWYRTRLLSLPALPVGEITEGDLLVWYAGLQGAIYTVHGYVRAVRRFFRWMCRFGGLERNPAMALDLPRLPVRGEEGISDDAAGAMLDAARAHVRDYAILRFVESTGCRLSGVVNLCVGDLNLEGRCAVVREKFDRERLVFLSTEACQAMRVWLDQRADGDSVFGLGGRYIYERFKVCARLAGVGRKWNPHQWRHRFGRAMSYNGMPLGVLSQIMGHSTVDITVRFYGQFSVGHQQELYDRYARPLRT